MSSPATSAQPKPKPGKDDVIDLVIEDFPRERKCAAKTMEQVFKHLTDETH